MRRYRTAIGLDLGRDAVKLVRAERRWGGKLQIVAGSLRLPRAGGDTAPIVRRWLESLRLLHEPCVLGVTGRPVLMKMIEVPPGDPRSVEQAAALEIAKFRELTSEDFVSGLTLLPRHGGHRRGLLVAIRSDALAPTMALPTAIGLNVVDIVPIPIAVYNAMERFEFQPEEPTLCMDIGWKSTEIAIGDRHGVRFVRHTDFGSSQFSEALSEVRRIPIAQAEEQLLAGAWNEPHIDDAIRLALTVALEPLAAEIDASLAAYRERFSETADNPVAIVLSGGGALLPGLPERLAERFHFPVRTADHLPLDGGHKDRPLFAVATGLALAAVARVRCGISLTPAAIRFRQARERARRYWLAAGITLLMALGVAWLGYHRAYQRDAVRQDQDRAVADRIESLRRKIERVSHTNEQIEAKLTAVYSLAMNRTVLLDVVQALASAKAPADWVTGLADTAVPTNLPSRGRRIATRPPTEIPARPFRCFQVHGFTPDPSFYSVRAMINAMQDRERIEAADLVAEPQPDPNDPSVRLWKPLGGIPFSMLVQARERPVPGVTIAPPAIDPACRDEAVWEQWLNVERERRHELLTEWQRVRSAFSTFESKNDVFDLPDEEQVGLIDFRVALMETRKRLREESRRTGTGLPSDFGLREVANQDRNVKELLYQLAAIRKLAAIAVDLHVSEIGRIEPQPPVTHALPGCPAYLEEYPIRITMTCRYLELMRLIEELGMEKHFVVLKEIRSARTSVEDQDLLNTTVVVAALLFPETTPEAVVP